MWNRNRLLQVRLYVKVGPKRGDVGRCTEMPRSSASLDWDKRDWRKPHPGDLLFDAQDFYKKSLRSPKRAVQARYGRASLILGVAAIEAISNDTLASIYELLMDTWPSECVGLPPWMLERRGMG